MPKTVLLADDSVTIQKVVGISLAGEDITLITVDNGDAAVEQAREKRPDVVLADIVMPGKDGYEVCQAIKSDPALQHIPVILLTGTFEAFDDERAQQVGAAAHISKPFEAQTLVDQVNRVLAGAPAAAPPAAAPAAAAPAAAAGQAPAEAFDFLDDSLGSVSAPDQEPALETETPLDLGSTADPLAFGDTTPSAEATAPTDEPSAAEQTIAMAERTIANLDDGPGAADSTTLTSQGLPDDDATATPDPGSSADDLSLGPDSSAGTVDDLLDFGFAKPGPGAASGDDLLLGIGVDDLAQATVVDPSGVSNFDVSASDLAGPLEAGSAPSAPADEPADAGQTVLEPPAPPPAAAGAPPELSAEATLKEIAPRLRKQLHETLEKIAWESFGDVTDKIVRQALERVEAIAWEVIPHMAETLIREEIRRMKRDVDES